ncbi:MAG: DUF2190 family protein [Ruthenibacterium sp.]
MNARYVVDAGGVQYTPNTNVSAGDIVVQSGLIGVAKCDITSGSVGYLAIEGTYEMKKPEAQVFDAGTKVYWNTISGCTSTASGNVLVGMAAETVIGGDTVVRVLLNK